MNYVSKSSLLLLFSLSLVVSLHAETDQKRRATKFEADHELLIEEHQLGLEVKAGKISSEEYKRRKKEAQERAAKVH